MNIFQVFMILFAGGNVIITKQWQPLGTRGGIISKVDLIKLLDLMDKGKQQNRKFRWQPLF